MSLISDGGSFTVNPWRADDTKVLVKFSKPASDDRSTLNGRPIHDAPSGAPVFDEALAWMDCEVGQRFVLGTHTLFVGEITAAEVTDDEARPATTQDTCMKYGGVKRH